MFSIISPARLGWPWSLNTHPLAAPTTRLATFRKYYTNLKLPAPKLKLSMSARGEPKFSTTILEQAYREKKVSLQNMII